MYVGESQKYNTNVMAMKQSIIRAVDNMIVSISRLKDSRWDSTPPSSLSMMMSLSLMNSAVLMATWFLSLMASSL